ncbi:MAG: hypothetical protein HC919_03130 [Oscillatoriales cyanobacterium SM2_2_1]|nr:hypothetical protein [Oscillatoriales cyanobacterium SM2_2_1]
MAAFPDADAFPPWLLKAIAKLQQTLCSVGPEMAPLLTAGASREKAIARLAEERQPLLRECLRRLPGAIEHSDLGRYSVPGVMSTLQKPRTILLGCPAVPTLGKRLLS